MRPGLPPGRIIIAVRRARLSRVGEVVVAVQGGHEIIKRVHQVDGTRLFIVGDDRAASTDSRSFGWLPHTAVRGIVIWPRVAR